MSATFVVRRCAAVSLVLLLACGAGGVAVSAALADPGPVVSGSAAPSSSPEPTVSQPVDHPIFTLTNNGAGSFSLALAIAGTPITVEYSVDATGSVTAASTSTAGASVDASGHDLTVTLVDGRVVKVELGDSGDRVKEVAVTEPNGENKYSKDSDHNDTGETAGSNDQPGDNEDASATPEPRHTASADHPDHPDDSEEASASPEPRRSASTDDGEGASASPEPQPTASADHTDDGGDHSDGESGN